MRLIDADALIKELQEQMKTATNPLFAMVCDKCIDCLEKHPSAYDVEKVVAKLEVLQCVNPFLTTTEYKHKAIDIVKRGGVE